MPVPTEKLVVTRGQMAKAFDRFAVKFAEATEKEIDLRVAAAIAEYHEKNHAWRVRRAIARLLTRRGKK